MSNAEMPAHVTIILDGHLRIGGGDRSLEELIRAHGLDVRRGRAGLEVYFPPSDEGGDLANDSLVSLLQCLAECGVAFAGDYKQMWSPSSVVAELVDRGVDFASPTKVGFDGHEWHRYPIVRGAGSEF